MLRAAVEQFIDKEPQQIEDVAMSTLEGHQVLKYFARKWRLLKGSGYMRSDPLGFCLSLQLYYFYC